MKLRKRLKKSTRQYIVEAIICIIVTSVFACIISFSIHKKTKDSYEEKLVECYRHKQDVTVANIDIKAGDIIRDEDVSIVYSYSDIPSEYNAGKSCVGTTALVDIPAGSQIINSLVTENNVELDLREMEYNVIEMSNNIVQFDTVDVRIGYPNGESYVVLSKKILKGYEVGSLLCYLWQTEEEIQRMSAAIVDASLYDGAKLYVTKYIDPTIQTASEVTYIPNLSVIHLIEKNPNIVEQATKTLNENLRKELENRLAESMGIDVSQIKWDLENYRMIIPEQTQETISSTEDEDTSENQMSKQSREESKPTGIIEQDTFEQQQDDTVENSREYGVLYDTDYFATNE